MRQINCSKEKINELTEMARRMRLAGLDMARSTGNKGAHIGGSFSCMEILAVLYGEILQLNPKNPEDPDRDRFLPSKNHCTLAHLPALAEKGFIPHTELTEFQKDGGRLTGYPKNIEIGLEYSGGSLGMALSVALGMALVKRKHNSKARFFVLLGDGELNEGSVWESFMFASQYHLDNVVAIVDRNHLSYDGNTEDVMSVGSVKEKLEPFGWNVIDCYGHSVADLLRAFSEIKNGKPNMIVADTIKGKGVSFSENNHQWHHHALTEAQYEQAKIEILAHNSEV